MSFILKMKMKRVLEVLLNYGVLNFEIIYKEKKLTSPKSDLIFDEYDLKWFDV